MSYVSYRTRPLIYITHLHSLCDSYIRSDAEILSKLSCDNRTTFNVTGCRQTCIGCLEQPTLGIYTFCFSNLKYWNNECRLRRWVLFWEKKIADHRTFESKNEHEGKKLTPICQLNMSWSSSHLLRPLPVSNLLKHSELAEPWSNEQHAFSLNSDDLRTREESRILRSCRPISSPLPPTYRETFLFPRQDPWVEPNNHWSSKSRS